MLKLKYLFEDFDLAKYCLKLYDYSDQNLDEMLNYYRISSNAIYPFYTENEAKICFLRLSPIEEKKTDEVASEIHYINWLFENGFPIMKPYPMKNGKLYDVITTPYGIFNISCFEKVKGQTLERTEGNIEIAYGYGKLLGEMHNLSEKYPYAEERRSYNDLINEIRSRFLKYKAPVNLLSELNVIENKLNHLEKNNSTFGLIHYDFEPDNVLFDAKTGKYGVIDLDDSIRCWYSLDITRAIDAMDDVVDDGLVDDAVAAFFDGYKSVRVLTDNEIESIPLMRKFVSLHEYATILHVLSDKPVEEPDWLIQIEERLTCRLRQIEEIF